MWYKYAQQKFNIYGLPITGFKGIKQFTDSNEDEIEEPINLPLEQNAEEDNDDIVSIDDPTPQDEFTPKDLETNVQILETDPTANMELPPLHSEPGCYCKIETRPILSQPGINDGLRVWIVNHFREDGSRINNCPKCTASAETFNKAEIQRLLNRGIDINSIPR